MDNLLCVGAEEELRNDAVLLGVDDDQVGLDFVGVVQYRVAIGRVGAYLEVVGDSLTLQEISALVDVCAQRRLLFFEVQQAEDVYLGAENLGHGGGGASWR